MISESFKKINKVSLVDKTYLIILFSLIFLLTYTMFIGREGFGSGELEGVGRIILTIDLILMAYLMNNLKYLRRVDSFTRIVLFWMPCVFFSCLNNFMDMPYTEYLIVVAKCFLWCFVYLFFYVFFKKNPKVLFVGKAYFSALAVFSSVAFYMVYSFTNRQVTDLYYQLNDVFFILLTLPWILLIKKPLWRQCGFFLVMLVILFSMKRSAFIVLFSALAAYLLIYLYHSRNRAKKLIFLSAFMYAIFNGYIYFSKYTGDFLMRRLESSVEDLGSGRIEIYEEVLHRLDEAGLVSFIFGHGYNSVINYTNMHLSAHNDFLEVMFDFGLLGFALYLSMHFLVFKKTIELVRIGHFYAGPFAVSFIIFFFMSLVSHLVIYPTYFLFLVAFWGGILGSLDSVTTNKRTIFY